VASGSGQTWKTFVLVVLFALAGAGLGWLFFPAHGGGTPGPRGPGGAYRGGQVEQVSEATFAEVVLQSRIPVLVDFYADWCAPCQRLAPLLDEVARDTPTARIVRVNVDQDRALAARYGVSAYPTLMVFKDGQVIATETGSLGKGRLKAMLDL